MDLTMHNTIPKRLISMEKNQLLMIMRLKLLVQDLHLIDIFHQLADKYNFHKQIINIKIEIYFMDLILFSAFYSLLSLFLILYRINHTTIFKLNHNMIGIPMKRQVPPMIIVDKKIHRIINLNMLVITSINSIVMIEQTKTFLHD